MIAIIDYGMGNLRSVQKAVEYLGSTAVVTTDQDIIKESTGVILPGVGAFPDAIANIKKMGFKFLIEDIVQMNKPLLGICLGMQLLYEESLEFKKEFGFGFLKGTISKIPGNVKIPHMGWNNLNIINGCCLLKGIEENNFAYFVHSYYAANTEISEVNAITEYSTDIPAVVSKHNVYGTQFHPEKSGKAGMLILNNFINICSKEK